MCYSRKYFALSFLFILLILTANLIIIQPALAVDTTLVSISSSRSPVNNTSHSPNMSSYGRFVAFHSWANNLVPNDTNCLSDVFIHDRWTGETSMVSVGSSGQGNYTSSYVSLSADGRFVAFHSYATNLVPDDTNGCYDVFIRDCLSGTTERVSVSTSGLQGNGNSYCPHISADGRYVAFHSTCMNFSPYAIEHVDQIYLHDMDTGETILVSQPSGSAGSANADCKSPEFSSDGRFVAFSSYATNLVTGFDNGKSHIYIRDLVSLTTTAVSRTAVGSQPNDDSGDPSMTGDGRYVAFESLATDLVSGDINNSEDIFVHDRNTLQTTLVSVNSSGVQGNDDSCEASISLDGSLVTFNSDATNLVPGACDSQIYVHTIESGQTVLVSRNSQGVAANGSCCRPAISSTGRLVSYDSEATNLAWPDLDVTWDVFVTGMNERFVSPDGTDAGSCEDPECPCRTIQYAVNASRNGDVIKLARGNYSSGFTLQGGRQSVHVEGGWSSDFSTRDKDPSLTVIDYHSGTVVWCTTTNKRLTLKLSGLTLRNGYDSGDEGGGITLANLGGFLELVLENVRIVDNQSEKGGGILVDTGGSGALSRIHLLRTQVLDNWATLSGGGGIYVETSAGAKTEMFIKNSVLAGNDGVLSGGGILVTGDGLSVLEILNSTVTGNTGNQHGGGIYCTGGAQVWVSNSIVWGNDQVNTYPGEDIWLAAPSYVHTAFSDLGNVVNYTLDPGTYVDGGNNFTEDPRFRDAGNGDFHLRGGSSAIGCGLCGSWFLDVGSSQWLYTREAPYFDLDDQRRPDVPSSVGGLYHLGCDVGADEFRMSLVPIYLLLLP